MLKITGGRSLNLIGGFEYMAGGATIALTVCYALSWQRSLSSVLSLSFFIGVAIVVGLVMLVSALFGITQLGMGCMYANEKAIDRIDCGSSHKILRKDLKEHGVTTGGAMRGDVRRRVQDWRDNRGKNKVYRPVCVQNPDDQEVDVLSGKIGRLENSIKRGNVKFAVLMSCLPPLLLASGGGVVLGIIGGLRLAADDSIIAELYSDKNVVCWSICAASLVIGVVLLCVAHRACVEPASRYAVDAYDKHKSRARSVGDAINVIHESSRGSGNIGHEALNVLIGGPLTLMIAALSSFANEAGHGAIVYKDGPIIK